jgi:hypothetical protein
MNMKMFEDFHLSEAILRAVRDEGYRQPTDIQRAAIPEILAGKVSVCFEAKGRWLKKQLTGLRSWQRPQTESGASSVLLHAGTE